jgi:predicted nucleic acid-binding protein
LEGLLSIIHGITTIFMTTKIICDADFLVALLLKEDSNHYKAVDLYTKYFEICEFVFLSITKYEIATVLSRKLQQKDAISMYKDFKDGFQNEIWFEKSWEPQVIDLYNSFTKKNISFFDCACMVLANKINAKIASFDNFYPAEILIN